MDNYRNVIRILSNLNQDGFKKIVYSIAENYPEIIIESYYGIHRLENNSSIFIEIDDLFNNGFNKIEAIKEVRRKHNNMGLKEAKELIDSYEFSTGNYFNKLKL